MPEKTPISLSLTDGDRFSAFIQNQNDTNTKHIYVVVSKSCPHCIDPISVGKLLEEVRSAKQHIIIVDNKSIYQHLKTLNFTLKYDKQNFINRLAVPSQSLLYVKLKNNKILFSKNNLLNNITEISSLNEANNN